MNKIEKYKLSDMVFFFPEESVLIPITDHGTQVSLTSHACACLLLLLDGRGELVSQSEFFLHVWESKGLYVTPNTFYQTMSILRKALRTSGINENVVRTVSKQGIKYIGKIEVIVEESPSQHLDDERGDGAVATSDVPESDPPQNDMDVSESYSFVINSKHIEFIVFLTAWLFFIIFLSLFFRNLNVNGDFFSNYVKIGRINECLVYADASTSLSNRNYFSDYLVEKKFSCKKNQIAYLTKSLSRLKTSIVLCDDNVQKMSSCVTHHFIENNDGKND